MSRRRSRARSMLVHALALALVSAGCSMLGPKTFELVLLSDQVEALPVTLTDVTGTVSGMELPTGDDVPQNVIGNELVVGVPGRNDAVAIGWRGGLCDRSVDIELRAQPQPVFTLHEKRGMGGCELMAISRFVIVVFNTKIDAFQMRLEVVSEAVT